MKKFLCLLASAMFALCVNGQSNPNTDLGQQNQRKNELIKGRSDHDTAMHMDNQQHIRTIQTPSGTRPSDIQKKNINPDSPSGLNKSQRIHDTERVRPNNDLNLNRNTNTNNDLKLRSAPGDSTARGKQLIKKDNRLKTGPRDTMKLIKNNLK